MAISAAELRSKTFEVAPKGYDRPEVHRYLNALANELQQLHNIEQSEGVAETDVVAPSTGPAEATPQPLTGSADDFDRVGNEISLMLRQAQESAMKIRSDAELEARTLVDQVRLDIESDRVAHEQAAGELIRRTDERALGIRLAAEDYARDTRKSVEEYQQARKGAIDEEVAEVESEAAATRKLTADHLAAANLEAQTTVADANDRAREIIKNAEADALARGEEILDRARRQLERLIAQEEQARVALEETRRSIQEVLAQPQLPTLVDDLDVEGPSESHGNV